MMWSICWFDFLCFIPSSYWFTCRHHINNSILIHSCIFQHIFMWCLWSWSSILMRNIVLLIQEVWGYLLKCNEKNKQGRGNRESVEGWVEDGLQVWIIKESLTEGLTAGKGRAVCPSRARASRQREVQNSECKDSRLSVCLRHCKAASVAGGEWAWEKADEVQVGSRKAGWGG